MFRCRARRKVSHRNKPPEMEWIAGQEEVREEGGGRIGAEDLIRPESMCMRACVHAHTCVCCMVDPFAATCTPSQGSVPPSL